MRYLLKQFIARMEYIMEKEPLLTIQPRFNAVAYFVKKYLLTVCIIIFLMAVTASANSGEYSYLIPYFLLTLAIYLAYIVVREIIQKKSYRLVQYLFYDDCILVVNRTKRGQDAVIRYSEVVDILVMQNYIQKLCDQGDLIIKLSEGKFFAKTFPLIGIGNFKRTTEEVSQIVYGG